MLRIYNPNDFQRQSTHTAEVFMKITVPAEIMPGERRVGLVPESISKLTNADFQVSIQAGAGEPSHFGDRLYKEAGASLITDLKELYQQADVTVKVQRPLRNEAMGADEIDLLPEGSVLVAFLQTLFHPDVAKRLAERNITSFSMDAIPRIARAQSMDALSSMSSLSGYKAVLIAADSLGKYFPLMMTAAGTVPPAQGLILGAGVAGLQAIATAKRLGAAVEVFDVRPAVKEQVESLGATFVEVDYGQNTEDAGGYARELPADAQERQRAKVYERIQAADFVVSTALIPGRQAPILITKEMVAAMKPGSVIVDIAAETGGNCELTEPGETVIAHDVAIHGPANLPSTVPTHSSRFYSRNVGNLLSHMLDDGQLQLDFTDPITSGCCITHAGEIRHERTKALLEDK